jgi:hypothetical protein
MAMPVMHNGYHAKWVRHGALCFVRGPLFVYINNMRAGVLQLE